MCARVCRWRWQEHRLSARRQGGAVPPVHTPQHPRGLGAGTTTSRGHRHHSHRNDHSSAVPPTPAEPALQICTPSTPSFPSTVHLSPGKCPGNVLLRFLGTNSTTERGIMARGLKFSFGKYQSVVLPLSTGISWHIMVGALWGWGVNLTGGLLPALCYYPLPRGSPRSGRPPSCVTF